MNILLSLLAFFLPVTVFAAIPREIYVYCGDLPGCQLGLREYLSSVVGLLLVDLPAYTRNLSGAVIAVGAAMLIVSVWKEDYVSKGKETITWAIIGLALSTFADQLVRFVGLEVGNRANGANFVYSVSNTIIDTIFDLLNITLFAVCLTAGAYMVISMGKDDQFTKGKDALFYAALGAVLLNLAQVIANAFATL